MRPAILNPLFAAITGLPAIGPKLAIPLEQAAGPLVVDLLFTLPKSITDRTVRPPACKARSGEIATLELTVEKHLPPSGRRRSPYRIVCSGAGITVNLVYFRAHPDYLEKTFPAGSRHLVSGKMENYNGTLQITHPDYIAHPDRPGDIPLFEPVYPLVSGLNGKVMRKAAGNAFLRAPELEEWQDPEWIRLKKWPSWKEALRILHCPQSEKDTGMTGAARARLAFDELLANQLALIMIRKIRIKSAGIPVSGDGRLIDRATGSLPFLLTKGQTAVLEEILADMASEKRMTRLIQGDVGSGKTIVAFFAMLRAVEAGGQAALMVPTELLAQQHLASLEKTAQAAGIRLDILAGQHKGSVRKEKLDRLENGNTDILIGTHAVFQDDVSFNNLVLTVIDEQHRFGVQQRLALTRKGAGANLLVMTATPIPRTLALTAYGDIDISYLREKPAGRQPVSTGAVPVARLDDILERLARAVARGEQAYWVCPLIAESDLVDCMSAEDRFKKLRLLFGDKAALVHGQMRPDEKERVMEGFCKGDTSILVATTVIEVGVNVPDATIMIIEHAERFGLAQLHQLRGRVGRGKKKSACILLYRPPLNRTARARLDILRRSEDGFSIAEEDLRLRGAGEILGHAQSGISTFRIADPAVHGGMLADAHNMARLFATRDPDLSHPSSRILRTLLYLFRQNDAVRLLDAG